VRGSWPSTQVAKEITATVEEANGVNIISNSAPDNLKYFNLCSSIAEFEIYWTRRAFPFSYNLSALVGLYFAIAPVLEMSDATPVAETSSPEEVSPPNTGLHDPLQNASATDRMVIEYLRARGHTSAERALLDAIDSNDPDDKGKGPDTPTISTEELVKKLAVYAQKPSRPGENVLNDSANVLQELTTMGNPTNIQNLIASIGAVGAEEILSLDPTDKQDGYTELEAWVEGSLDMYRVSQQFC
jgi:hypothetical protein